MRVPHLLLMTATMGCTAEGDNTLEPCPSGIREAFAASVATPTGGVQTDMTQCVTAGWSFLPCEDGQPEHCNYFFGPNQPASAPPSLIFGEFVFQTAVGHLESSGPSVLDGSTSIRPGLEAAQATFLEDGYFTSPIRSSKRFGDRDAWGLTVSCDHPDTAPVCPFTWEYLFVDLSLDHPGVYVDLSAQFAEYVPSSAARPDIFLAYDEMHESIQLTL